MQLYGYRTAMTLQRCFTGTLEPQQLAVNRFWFYAVLLLLLLKRTTASMELYNGYLFLCNNCTTHLYYEATESLLIATWTTLDVATIFFFVLRYQIVPCYGAMI